MNEEFFTADFRISLRMVRTSEFRKMKKVAKELVRFDDARGMLEKMLAVFEVDKLDRVLIVKDGCEWREVRRDVIRINALREPFVQVFEVVNKKLVEKEGRVCAVFAENSQVVNDIEDRVEFLDKCGATGYSIIIYPINQMPFNYSSDLSELKPIQIKAKITNILEPHNYNASLLKVRQKQQNRSDYKASILKTLKSILK